MSITERENTEVVSAPAERVLSDRERRARVLEAAALEIEVRGWATGDGECPTGEVCLIGGIARAIGEEPNACEFWEDYAAQFGGPVFQPSKWRCDALDDSLYGWNDMPGRTADEVTFLLRWRAEEIRDGR